MGSFFYGFFLTLLNLILIFTATGNAYQRFDGWFNNPINPGLTRAGVPMLFPLPTAYEDMTYLPSGSERPNARSLSNDLFTGKTGLPSNNNWTSLFAHFGKFVSMEISHTLDSACPTEILRVPILGSDPDFDDNATIEDHIPYERIAYDVHSGLSPNNPRRQVNLATSLIDASVVYGNSEVWANALRDWYTGKLKSSDQIAQFPAMNEYRLPIGSFPFSNSDIYPDPTKYWQFGDPSSHENPALLTLSVLFFRWHNFLVKQTADASLSKEDLFYKARSKVIATLQKIILYDWLPLVLNETIEPYKGYNPNVDPGLSSLYDAVAMNYYLTLIPPILMPRNKKCEHLQTIRLCGCFWNSQVYLTNESHSFDSIILGMVSQFAEQDDMVVSSDFKGKYFGTMSYSRQDCIVQTIMKGRDLGLPDYNSARVALGMDKIKSWNNINPKMFKRHPQLLQKFKLMHNNSLNNIDIFTGAMMETTETGPGEFIKKLTKDQFLRIRNGDRFWFENNLNGMFTDKEIQEIKSITLKDIIVNVTNINQNTLQDNVFIWHQGDSCEPITYNMSFLKPCPSLKEFDFFVGSEVSFIASWVVAGIIPGVCILFMCLLKQYRIKLYRAFLEDTKTFKKSFRRSYHHRNNIHKAYEWIEYPESFNKVDINFNSMKGSLDLTSGNKILRSVSFNNMEVVDVSLTTDKKRTFLLLKVPKEYDLILEFINDFDRCEFSKELEQVMSKTKTVKWFYIRQKELMKSAVTRKKRTKMLEAFLKSVFSEAFHLDYDPSLDHVEFKQTKELLEFEMTKAEFAESLALKIDSDFVEKMFMQADSDKNNYISIKEFINIVVLFTKGTCQDKLRMLFRMYDLDSNDSLNKLQLTRMFQSLLEMSQSKLNETELNSLMDSMIKETGLEGKTEFNFEDFCHILSPQMDKLWNCTIDWKAPKACFPAKKNLSEIKVDSIKKDPNADNKLYSNFTAFEKYSPFRSKLKHLRHFLENNKQHIFFIILFYAITCGLFAERFYYYTVEREKSGLRQIMSYGLSVTRGAAAGMSFTYSLLLITMCRNFITFLRGTFLNLYIPFDSHVAFHKIVAWTALAFTAFHVVGYGFNFYHIAMQPTKIFCVFKSIHFRTDFMPKFYWWLFGNLTGMTGVLLTILIIVIYIFATQMSRRYIFKAFWLTHKLIIPLYILAVLHGSSVLVQKPMFWCYFIGPVIAFVIDKMISLSRKRTEISVVRAEKLPSDVSFLEFKRPTNFEYKSGQWVRIACDSLGKNEFHPFTLTSAPHEDTLSAHIRALGPWTSKIREIFNPENLKEQPYPKLYVDGPYGAGQQDWYRFDVSILVGAGIGVTPYAAILKDFVHMNAMKNTYKIKCQKVHFIWVTGSHRHFEWLIDILQEVEQIDTKGIVSIDIFITKFFQHYDLRTAMLYICEEYFQKHSGGRSVFTGLKAKTHFGRPQLGAMMKSIHQENPHVRTVGVFSCGPPGMTKSVEAACNDASKSTKALFKHHFENF